MLGIRVVILLPINSTPKKTWTKSSWSRPSCWCWQSSQLLKLRVWTGPAPGAAPSTTCVSHAAPWTETLPTAASIQQAVNATDLVRDQPLRLLLWLYRCIPILIYPLHEMWLKLIELVKWSVFRIWSLSFCSFRKFFATLLGLLN